MIELNKEQNEIYNYLITLDASYYGFVIAALIECLVNQGVKLDELKGSIEKYRQEFSKSEWVDMPLKYEWQKNERKKQE